MLPGIDPFGWTWRGRFVGGGCVFSFLRRWPTDFRSFTFFGYHLGHSFQTLRNAFCDSRKLCIKRETGRTRNGQALRINIRCTSAPLTKSTLLFDSNLLGLATACSLQLWMITFPYPPPKKPKFYDSTRLNGPVTLTVLGLVWCSPDNSPIRSSRSDGLVEIGCRLLTVLGFPGNG